MLVGGNRTQIEGGVHPACTTCQCVTWGELLYFSESVSSSVEREDSFPLASEWGVPELHALAGSSPRPLEDTCRGLVDTAVPMEPWQHLGRADLGVSSGE